MIYRPDQGSTKETDIANVLIAQVQATLALVEQQRIANLIAIVDASLPHRLREAACHALYTVNHDEDLIEVNKDMAEALGIKAE